MTPFDPTGGRPPIRSRTGEGSATLATSLPPTKLRRIAYAVEHNADELVVEAAARDCPEYPACVASSSASNLQLLEPPPTPRGRHRPGAFAANRRSR